MSAAANHGGSPRRPRPESPFRRRLRRTSWTLAAIAFVAVAVGLLVHRLTRPEVRRPGEALEDVTTRLRRDLPADAPEPRFERVTERAGLDGFVAFVGPRTSQLPEDMGSGAAWGDYDNDGDDDLFLVAAGGSLDLPPEERAPSLLYENLGDGTFRRDPAFPELRIQGMGAAWGDYDGDGRLDLAVSGYRSLLLFHNRGGRLEPGPELPAPEGYWAGLAWGDFDADRDLDLYVCGYVRYVPDTSAGRAVSRQYGNAVPYTLNPATYEPEPNLLLENDGRGGFTDVAALWGVSNPGGRSLSALWHDFDEDGRLDLYVANDISDNALYLNRGDTFEDAGLAAWVADYRGAMGLAAGDWNRDGDDDLFVTHWVAQENALYDSRLRDAAPTPAAGGEGARPAAARLTFSDLAAPLGVGQIALPMVGWGTEFADLDGDGWLDLVVANGSTLETSDEPPRLKRQPAMLLWNRRGEHFHDLAPLAEELARPRVGRGLALADPDRDGDLDLLVVDLESGVELFENRMQTGHWLELRLRTRPARPGALPGFADGARAEVTAGGAVLRRTVGGASYLSQSSRTLHFGLGEATRAERVVVHWPAGGTESHGPLAGDTAWELVEGRGEARALWGAAASAGSGGGPDVAAGQPSGSGRPAGTHVAAAPPASERERVMEFWRRQRAAMDAMKVDRDPERASELFRSALELDPSHSDSRYYLAQSLATLDRADEALAELDRLRRAEPDSHRAHKGWGVLRARTAASPAHLREAGEALERALEINREETGSLQALGELALLTGRPELARERFEWVNRTNSRAVGALFLRGYLAWSEGDGARAAELLAAAREARGEDFKPEGATAEGDVESRTHRDLSPLSHFVLEWSGTTDPGEAYAPLATFLRASRDR